MSYHKQKEVMVDLVLPENNNYINKNTYLRKSTTKTANLIEDKKIAKKQRIREIIKQPKEKFLTKNQEEYWRILGDNEITLCFGPAGVGKSYIRRHFLNTCICDRLHQLRVNV